MGDERGKEVRLHVDFRGADAASLPWSELRPLMDAFVAALSVLAGPDAGPVSLRRVDAGSVMPIVRGSPAIVRASQRLAKGPSKKWSHEQRRKVEPLYEWARSRGATMQVGGPRSLRPIVVPDFTTLWTLRESAQLTGTVLRVGGMEGRVQIRFDLEGPVVHCDAGEVTAKKAGQFLYERVQVSGPVVRDVNTFALLSMKIEHIDRAPARRSAREVLSAIDELIGNSMDGFDVLAASRASRA